MDGSQVRRSGTTMSASGYSEKRVCYSQMFHAHLSCVSPQPISTSLADGLHEPAGARRLARRLCDSDGFMSDWQPQNTICHGTVGCSFPRARLPVMLITTAAAGNR